MVTAALLVNGERVEVAGVLTWVPSHSPAPWTMAGVVIAAAVAWLCTRYSAAGPLALAAAGALTVGIAEASITPPDAGGITAMWLAPAAALACAVGAYARPRARGELVVAAIVLLSVWVALRLPAVVMPILTSPLPTGLERGIVVTVLAIAVAVTVSLLRLHLPKPSTG